MNRKHIYKIANGEIENPEIIVAAEDDPSERMIFKGPQARIFAVGYLVGSRKEDVIFDPDLINQEE